MGEAFVCLCGLGNFFAIVSSILFFFRVRGKKKFSNLIVAFLAYVKGSVCEKLVAPRCYL